MYNLTTFGFIKKLVSVLCVSVTFLRIFSLAGTYNTALKATRTVLEGEVAQTEAETDYTQPRKRKKNRRYISSSSDDEENESLSNVPHGTSSEIPAPDSQISNKLKILLKNKSMKTSAICQQKETSVGKLFSRNESHVKSSSFLKSITTSNESPIQQHSLQNKGIFMYIFVFHELFLCFYNLYNNLFYNLTFFIILVTQEKYLSPKDCNTQMAEKCVTAEPSQSKKTKPVNKLHNIFPHLNKENCRNSFNSKLLNFQVINFPC